MSRVRELNDAFRRTGQGGRVVVTRGVAAAVVTFVSRVLEAVRGFDAFTPDNDPYGEHDFGALELDGRKLFWKIDAYDADERYGSPDPADPAVTSRVLTIMLAEEY